jgi:hypothetical protein
VDWNVERFMIAIHQEQKGSPMNDKTNFQKISFSLWLLLVSCAYSQAYVNPPGPPPTSPPFLDQSQIQWGSSSYIQGDISMAQTFTSTIGGSLTRLDLCLSRNNDSETQPLVISIDATQNGVPTTTLGSTVFNSFQSDVWAWYSFDFSSQSITFAPNQTYAIVLSNYGSFNGISSEGTTYDSYLGGQTLVQNGVDAPWQNYSRELDMTFQTWVTPVPEPSSLAIVVASCLALISFCSCPRRI